MDLRPLVLFGRRLGECGGVAELVKECPGALRETFAAPVAAVVVPSDDGARPRPRRTV